MRKTRRASKKATAKPMAKAYPPMNIPELRSAFEQIEQWVLDQKETGPALVKAFQKEWEELFRKPVDRDSAEAYIEHVKGEARHYKKQKKQKGGAVPLAGAPLDYTTRAGLYVIPGVNQHSYPQVPNYVDSGFWNPEIAQQYDPVPGQTIYPTRTPLGMGSNLVGGGSRKKRGKKTQKGGSLWSSTMDSVHQLMFRPISTTTPPPSAAMDAQNAMRGQTLGQSPDVTQTRHTYQMSPRPVPVVGAVPISAIHVTRSSLG
jgi:hypothetical protein